MRGVVSPEGGSSSLREGSGSWKVCRNGGLVGSFAMLGPAASTEEDGVANMGKMIATVMALADLGLLVLLITAGSGNVLREAGLATSFLLLGALAWVAAFFTALYTGFRTGRDWRWVVLLIVFLWLPAVPVLAYGVSGLHRMPVRSKRLTATLSTPSWTLPAADRSLLSGRRQRGRRPWSLHRAA
jgi:hypothetical protein